MPQSWHTMSIPGVFDELRSTERGLDAAEAELRLRAVGPNALPDTRVDSLAAIFARQFWSPLIATLIVAALIVFTVGETMDGVMILAVLLFNAVVGTVQEGRARNALSALRQFVTTNATVLRAGYVRVISDRDVVTGDVLLLHEGDKVPADARVVRAHGLRVDAAALTGESEPVEHVADALTMEHLPVAEQRNMLFRGTHVVAGEGSAVVVATGTNTAIGKISQAIATIDTEIPLHVNIRDLSRHIIVIVVSISVVLFVAGLAFGNSAADMFATVVALSVSIIPEGLPIVMTLVLATGVWRMAKRHVLVKRLHAVDALGQAGVLLVDKTGTITRNEMVVQQVHVDGRRFTIGGVGYEPRGEVRLAGDVIDPLNHSELLFIGRISAFGASARLAFLEERRQWSAFGDPTEAALVAFAQKLGFQSDILERESPRIAELPFDSRTKYRATIHRVDGRTVATVVGAPEVVLRASDQRWTHRDVEPFIPTARRLSAGDRAELEAVLAELSGQGFRVLGIAIRYDVPTRIVPEQLTHLVFVGFVALRDALRPEVQDAVARARAAGMRVVMITGDHERTARAIAEAAGIARADDEVLTGAAVDRLSVEALTRRIPTVAVFARVTPEQKLSIVEAYRRRGEIVAVTGDGVNDAPALVAADLGVAMGTIGTAVAREASDIVLLDDNFGSIVAAVEEGRSIAVTIRKVILYLFSTSAGEVLTIGGAMLLSFPLPISPAQIIWLNFVTDGFLDVALAMEPKEDGLLRRRFNRSTRSLVDAPMVRRMFSMAVPMMIGTLVLFSVAMGTDLAKAWTVSLTTLAVFQWFNAWNCRHASMSILQMRPFSNPYLVAATAIVVLLQLAAIYSPLGQQVLRTTPLTFSDWLTIVPVAASILVVEEVRKWRSRRTTAGTR